jgi:hypothetical protein
VSIHRAELAANWERTQVPSSVAVDQEFGTIVWPGNIDLDPDALRGDQAPASGLALRRRVVQPA